MFENLSFPLVLAIALIIVLILFGLAYVLTKNQNRIVGKKEDEPGAFDVDRENVRNLMGDNTR